MHDRHETAGVSTRFPIRFAGHHVLDQRGNEPQGNGVGWRPMVLYSVAWLMFVLCWSPTRALGEDASTTRSAAASPHVEAGEHLLVRCFPFGGNPNAEKKIASLFADSAAVESIRHAAGQGNGTAMTLLGWMHEKGFGVPPNAREAIQWFHKAAERGHPLAQAYAGCWYVNGGGGPENVPRGVAWIREAAAKGVDLAQADLGILYLTGEAGVRKDPPEGLRWLRKAVDNGHAHGQYGLGSAYYGGIGVEKDVAAGLKLLVESAEGGHPYAQLKLADHYKGDTDPVLAKTALKYRDAAVKWLRTAAQRGDEGAKKELDRLGVKD